MNRRQLGIFVILAALLIGALANLRDLFKGQAFHFGTAQMIVSLGCLVIATVGVLLAFTHLPLPKLPRLDWLKPVRWLEQACANVADFLGRGKRPQIAGAVIIAGFALFALLYTLGRWNGVSPFIYVGSDASYISSYAASLDHPGQFSADYFLSNQNKVDSYFALHVPLVRSFERITGAYGNAFLVLLYITIFSKLLGFYLVGKCLFGSRALALLLAVITFPAITTGAWDYWGLIGDALPRNLFEIALPWLLLVSIKWIDRPKRWYLLSFLLGLLVYVHSISAGICFAALMLIYLVLAPSPFGKRLGQAGLSVLIFAATALPFAYFYSTAYTSSPTVSLSYEESVQILMTTYGQNHFNVLEIVKTLLLTLIKSGILPLALVALVYHLFNRKAENNHAVLIIGGLALAILLVSAGGPYLERLLDPWLHMVSVQMMLVRGLRYLPPILLLFSMLAFFTPVRGRAKKYPHLLGLAGVILVAVSFGMTLKTNTQDQYVKQELSCLSSGHIICPTEEQLDALDMIQALDRYTTAQDTILPVPPLTVSYANAIRYQALRPMGYTKNDVVRLRNNPALLQEISLKMKPWNALEHADANTRLQSYIDMAAEMHADYLIIQVEDFKKKTLQSITPVYANDHYMLVKIDG